VTAIRGFRHFVASMPAPVASGWSGRRVGLAPTGKTPPCHGARGTQSLTQSVATGNLRPKAKSQVDKLRRRDMAKKKGGIKFTILPLTPDL